jgi:hypothetical protein
VRDHPRQAGVFSWGNAFEATLTSRPIGEPTDKAPAEDGSKQGEKPVENGRQLHLTQQRAFPPDCGTCANRDVLRIAGQSFPNPVKANSFVTAGIDRDFHGFPSTDYGCLIWF